MKSNTNRTVLALLLVSSISTYADSVTGQWDFNGGYSATVGTALQPTGLATTDTAFGTTTSFGIPNIAGLEAQVMRFPKLLASADGYKMFHGAAVNGSTADVNQFSLVMDLLYPAASTGYRALLQTSAANSNDGDWFLNSSSALGINGMYSGTFSADAWHRIALVVDLEQTDATKKFLNYIDGAFVGYSDLGTSGAPGGRFALYPEGSGNPAWVFSDEDGETGLGYVNSLQFRDYAMTATEVAALGGATAFGITVVPEPSTALMFLLGAGLVVGRVLRRDS